MGVIHGLRRSEVQCTSPKMSVEVRHGKVRSPKNSEKTMIQLWRLTQGKNNMVQQGELTEGKLRQCARGYMLRAQMHDTSDMSVRILCEDMTHVVVRGGDSVDLLSPSTSAVWTLIRLCPTPSRNTDFLNLVWAPLLPVKGHVDKTSSSATNHWRTNNPAKQPPDSTHSININLRSFGLCCHCSLRSLRRWKNIRPYLAFRHPSATFSSCPSASSLGGTWFRRTTVRSTMVMTCS